MRGLVAGLEAVLPDGSVYDGLAVLKKDNRGYDLTQLLICAEGTLGIVTAATLRPAPPITARAVGRAGCARPTDAPPPPRRRHAPAHPTQRSAPIRAPSRRPG